MGKSSKREQVAATGKKRTIKAHEKVIFINIVHYVAIDEWKKIEGIGIPFQNKAVHQNDGTVHLCHFTFQVCILLLQDLFVLAQKSNQGVR